MPDQYSESHIFNHWKFFPTSRIICCYNMYVFGQLEMTGGSLLFCQRTRKLVWARGRRCWLRAWSCYGSASQLGLLRQRKFSLRRLGMTVARRPRRTLAAHRWTCWWFSQSTAWWIRQERKSGRLILHSFARVICFFSGIEGLGLQQVLDFFVIPFDIRICSCSWPKTMPQGRTLKSCDSASMVM